MEWVETTARTVEEAIDQALDQLGVDEQEAEWEVLEEPRPGLFGRVRGQARIRARIKPKVQPAKQDRRDRRRGRSKAEGDRSRRGERSSVASTSDTDQSDADVQEPAAEAPERSSPAPERTPARSEDAATTHRERNVSQHAGSATADEVAEQVETFLTGLVEAFGETAEVRIDKTEDEVVGRVDAKIGLMIGPKGHTLEAIQELTRMTAQRATPSDIRIKVDVGDYRAHRLEALERFARQVAERVRESRKAVALEPMPAADRKAVHDALAEEHGVVTSSDGAEPRRRVVVSPADDD